MKKTFRYCTIAIIIILSIGIGACTRQKNPAIDHIPANASMVLSIDINRLSEKSDFNSMKDNFIFKMLGMMLAQKNIPDFIQDRSLTGIDFNQSIYAATLNSDSLPLLTLAFVPLKDEHQFSTLLEKADNNLQFKDQNGINSADNNQFYIGVKNKLAIILIQKKIESNEAFGIIKNSFDLQAGEGLAAHSKGFSTFMSQNNDIGIWFNMPDINWNQLKKHGNIPFDPGSLFDINAQLALNFEKGYTHIHTESFANDSSVVWMKNILNNDFDKSLYAYLPDALPAAVGRVHVNPESLFEILNHLGMLDSMESHSAMTKDNIKNIFSKFTGDLLFSFDGFINADKAGYENPKPSILMVAGIKDSSGFLSNLKENIVLDSLEMKGHFMDSFQQYMVLKPKAWVFSNNPAYRNKMKLGDYVANGNLDAEIEQDFENNQAAILVDFQQLDRIIKRDHIKNVSQGLLDAIKSFDKLVIYQNQQGDFHNTGDIYLYLMDKKKNSLQSIIQTSIGAMGGSLFNN